MSRPRLLDLFCGAGGAAMGYHRAGFEVVGVDIKPQPHYPFEFIRWDAMTYPLDGFDAIHASPPCQHFTKYRNCVKDITERYSELIGPLRERLLYSLSPAVIENVGGAPLISPLLLCGSMFDLDVRRHRYFETLRWTVTPPAWPCRHGIWSRRYKSSSGRKPNSRYTIEIGSWDEPLERQKRAMGVDWFLTTRELSEAIPPAYTQYIGEQLMRVLESAV